MILITLQRNESWIKVRELITLSWIKTACIFVLYFIFIDIEIEKDEKGGSNIIFLHSLKKQLTVYIMTMLTESTIIHSIGITLNQI